MVRRLAPTLAAGLAVAAVHWLSRPEFLVGDARVLVLCVLVGAALVLVGLPGVACAALLQRRTTPALVLGLAVVGSGLAGWLLFLGAFAHLGLLASVLVSAGSAALLAVRPMERGTAALLAMPVLFASLLGVGYLAVAADHRGLDQGNQMVTLRYWPVIDNQLSQIFLDKLLDDPASLRPTLVGDWQASDRPPLETGMMLTAYPFVPPAGRAPAGLVLGVAANVLWVLGLWSLLRTLRAPEDLTSLVVLAVGLAGTVFVNTVYAWPKMLAAALALVATAAVLERSANPWLRLGLAGAAASLAMLAHGAAIFGLVAILPLLWTHRGRLGWRHLAAGAAVALALYAPWLGFQHFYAPPGDRLLKWHLAGVGTDQPVPGPVLQSIVTAYRTAGPLHVAVFKLDNVRLLLGDPTPWIAHMGHWTPGWDLYPLGRIREYLLTSLAPTPGVLLLGLPFLLVRRVRQAPWCAPVVSLVALSALLYAALEWGGRWQAAAWLHTAPYALLVLWCALGALAAGEFSRRLLAGLLAGQAVLFVGLWVHGVTLQSALTAADPGRADLSMDLLAVLAFAGLALTALVPWSRRRVEVFDRPGPVARGDLAAETRSR